jgi:uncharacterized protein (TIGR03067 family)
VLGLALLAGACDRAETDGNGGPAAEVGPKDQNARNTEDPKPPPRKKSPPSKDAKDEAAQRELQRLEGTWIPLDIEHDGGKVTDSDAVKWVIRNGRCGVYLDQQKRETWALKLDPTRNPKTIEARLVIASTGRRLAGIYELDGDKLKVCYDLTGRDFPTEFSAPKRARRINYIFRRE